MRYTVSLAALMLSASAAMAASITLTDLVADVSGHMNKPVELTGGVIYAVAASPGWVNGFYSDGVTKVPVFADMKDGQTIRRMISECTGRQVDEGCKVSISGKLVADSNFGGKLVDVVIVAP